MMKTNDNGRSRSRCAWSGYGGRGRDDLSERASRWACGGLLMLTLAFVAMGGVGVQAQWGPPGGGQTPPPKAPVGSQECMSNYLDNIERCQDIYCSTTFILIAFWESCDDDGFDSCEEKAEATRALCLQELG